MKKKVNFYDLIILLLIPVCGAIATISLTFSYLSSILFFLGITCAVIVLFILARVFPTIGGSNVKLNDTSIFNEKQSVKSCKTQCYI